MHERPIGDLVDALRALGCDDRLTSGQPGLPAAAPARPAGGALHARRADPRARRRLEPVPDRAAAGAAAGERRRGDIVIEVEGELISKPYVEITLNLLARFGIAVRARRLAALHRAARQPLPLAGRHPRRGRRVVGVVLHRARRDRGRRGAPLRIEGVGSDSIQGDIRFVDAARAMGAQVRGGPGLAARCGAAPGRCARSRSTATTSPTPR